MLRLRRHTLLATLAMVAILLPLMGCHQDEVKHYRIPKESAAPMPPPEPSAGSNGMPENAVPAPPRPEGQASLKWTLPKGWTSTQSGGMRFATLKPTTPGHIDISVVVLPGPAGGELANVNRWRGQIGLPAIDEKALASERRVIKTKVGDVSLFDFTSQGAAKSRTIVGLLSAADGNTWFLKMTGDDEPVGRTKSDFLHWMESLRLD